MSPLALAVLLRVVEIAGGRAYLEPGEAAGVGRGAKVTIGGRERVVVSASGRWVAIELGDAPVKVGDAAEADATPAVKPAQARAAPEPLERFRGAWPAARRPAEDQRPRAVPLGATPRRVWAALGARGWGSFPADGGATGGLALDARLHAEPWARPLHLDADGSLLLWLGDGLKRLPGERSRPALRLHELELAWGELAAVGRLRLAAAGLLDGVRLRTPSLRGFTLGAFGGLPPEVDGGVPGAATRFGAEAAFQGRHVMASLVALGSVFEGSLDERRLIAGASGWTGPLDTSASVEVSGFDADNPWGAPRAALTSAAASARLRLGAWSAGASAAWRELERSRWLASLLPPAWLDGDTDGRLAGSVDAGLDLRRLSAGAGASLIAGEGPAAWADLRLSGLGARLELGISAQDGSLLDTAAVRLGVGALVLHDTLDVSAYYRAAALRYQASLADLVEHRAGGELVWSPSPTLDARLGVEVLAGGDARGVLVLGGVVVRLGR